MATVENKPVYEDEPTRRVSVLLAEFDTPGGCMKAAEKLRDAGYKYFDTHTPFPVHGMDAAMGMKPSILGWIVLVMGLTGLSAATAMIVWMNGIDYPLIIGGKPPISIPAMVPVCFELTILLSAFGAVLGMFHLNRLPRHHHPVFDSERFRLASDDRFFISIEADDPKFDVEKTRELLQGAHAANVEVIEEEAS
jgi:hypothetical protein